MLLPDFHRQIRALPWLVMGLFSQHFSGYAQTTTAPPLVLRPSSLLQESIPKNLRSDVPSFIQSDTLNERSSIQTDLNGQVIIRRGSLLLKADSVEYDQAEDLAKARGNVSVNQSGNIYEGPALDLYIDAYEGFFTQPSYKFLKNNAYGNAERIDFIDNSNSVIHKASYTTCQRKPGPSWVPDWFFTSDKISIDSDRNSGLIEGGKVTFKGVTVPVPEVEVPISDERKSGFLPPNIGADSIGGLEYTQPYYWNLAPNRDITFTPTIWSKRGINLGTEFRYLEGSSAIPAAGQIRLNYMERDQERDNQRRWSTSIQHTGLMNPFYAGGAFGLNVNINRASDDNYWKDFSLAHGAGVQRLLSSDVGLSWTNGYVTTGIRAHKWQTLQDLASPLNRITPPFDRLPQLTARLQRFNIAGGFDFSIDGDFTRFSSVREIDCSTAKTSGRYDNCAPNADRSVSWAQLSRPFVSPYGYVTPKVQLHSRSYQFDGGLPNVGFYGHEQGRGTVSVTVPTFSLDSGMAFERVYRLFDRSWIQTLEPRIFYVHTPYRDQSFLPNYDSGLNAFNFASIFTENAFGGHDRISDANLLTLGVTSRFIDPETGAEGARFGIAQRLRFDEQRVTLPNEPTAQAGISDLLLGASVNVAKSWAVDSTIQYNPDTGNTLRRVIGGRYQPGPYRVLSAALRTENSETSVPVSRQIDFGWQWPLHDLWGARDEPNASGRGLGEGRWYSVGRMNYNLLDEKIVESILGFEYDAGCWVSRVVTERIQVADGLARQRILFQLELIGMSRVGTNALGTLRTNVSRYQTLNPPMMSPSRFGNYD